jgi:hypothetical protein
MGRGLDGYFDIRSLALCGFEGPGRGWSRPVSGGYGEGETPLPIPNRAVKPLSADGTWPERAWESRSPPVFLHSTIARSDRMTDARSGAWDPGVRSGASDAGARSGAPDPCARSGAPDPCARSGAPDPCARSGAPDAGAGRDRAVSGSRSVARRHPVAAFFRANPQVFVLAVICLVLGLGTFLAVVFGLLSAGSAQTTGEPSGAIFGAHLIVRSTARGVAALVALTVA